MSNEKQQTCCPQEECPTRCSNRNFDYIIIVVLYILLAIILSTCLHF